MQGPRVEGTRCELPQAAYLNRQYAKGCSLYSIQLYPTFTRRSHLTAPYAPPGAAPRPGTSAGSHTLYGMLHT